MAKWKVKQEEQADRGEDGRLIDGDELLDGDRLLDGLILE